MRTALLGLTTLAAVLVSLSPPVLQAQDGVIVTDFSTTTGRNFGLTGLPILRRGVTSTVEINKNLIDLVPFNQIHVRGGAGIVPGSITNGRTASGTGFIRMSMVVPPLQGIGQTITLDVGLIDHFTFTVQHTGLITALNFSPNPATVVEGTPIILNGTGVDFDTPEVSPITCHTVVMGARPPSPSPTFTATATRNSTCSFANAPSQFDVLGKGTGDPALYATAQAVFRFTFPAYLGPAPPTPGLTCLSAPGIGVPVITSPSNGQVFAFAAGANASQQLAVTWNLQTGNSSLAPNNEWIVTSPPERERGLPTSTTVRGTQFLRSYPLPGTYRVSVKAKNCGEAAPSATVSFELKFQ